MRKNWVLLARNWVLLALILLIGLALGWALVSRALPPRFTEEKVARIHEGMTEEEVVAILGKPAGYYASFDAPDVLPPESWKTPEGYPLPDGTFMRGWVSDAGAVEVYFRPDGRVRRSRWEFVGTHARESTLLHLYHVVRSALPRPLR
ncbi:MAG TPA: hypothetical protein VG013_12545 [Gemmataceae bacterium]|jgi:hypothetical protein|nr:hypothetical protein [Gemmataceae bacterium]